MSPIVALVIHIAGITGFIWFVFYWSALFSKRIEPTLRHSMSQRLGIEIIRRQKGPNYRWATLDKRPKSRALVFVWCVFLFAIIGSGPMILALLLVGLILNNING